MPAAYAPLLATLAAQESNVYDPRALLSQQPFQSMSPRGRQDIDLLRQLLANQIAREATQTARETPNLFRPGPIGRVGYETFLGGLERAIAEAQEGRLQEARAADVRPIRGVREVSRRLEGGIEEGAPGRGAMLPAEGRFPSGDVGAPFQLHGVRQRPSLTEVPRVRVSAGPRTFRSGGIVGIQEEAEIARDPAFPEAMRARRAELLRSGSPGVQAALVQQETAGMRTGAMRELQDAKDAAAMARTLVQVAPQQAAVAARLALGRLGGLVDLVRERTQAERYGAGEANIFGLGGDPENLRLMGEVEQLIREMEPIAGTGAGAAAGTGAGTQPQVVTGPDGRRYRVLRLDTDGTPIVDPTPVP